MAKPGVKRNFFQRLFGICATAAPADGECWRYEGGEVIVDPARAPELSGENGAVRLEGKGLRTRILLFKGVDGRLLAFGNRCSHMGRRLDPVPGHEQVHCCSLGGSRYDYEGKVLGGMGKEAVPVFEVVETEGGLKISVG